MLLPLNFKGFHSTKITPPRQFAHISLIHGILDVDNVDGAVRYFLSRLLRRFPSVPLASAPLRPLCSSPELTAPPTFRALVLRK